MTTEELKLPAKHLRACEVIEQAEHLNKEGNQHAKPETGLPMVSVKTDIENT